MSSELSVCMLPSGGLDEFTIATVDEDSEYQVKTVWGGGIMTTVRLLNIWWAHFELLSSSLMLSVIQVFYQQVAVKLFHFAVAYHFQNRNKWQ